MWAHPFHRISAFGLFVLVLLTAAGAGAQTPIGSATVLAVADTSTSPARSVTPAVVVFREDTLFTIHDRLGPFSPEDRAAAIRSRLARVAASPLTAADTLALFEGPVSTDIYIGPVMIATVTEGEAAGLGRTRRSLAEEWGRLFAAAITVESSHLHLRDLLIRLGLSALATIALLVVFRLIALAFTRVRRFVLRMHDLDRLCLRIQRVKIVSSEQSLRIINGAEDFLRFVATIAAVYTYLLVVLSQFPWTRGFARRLSGYFLMPISKFGASFLAYLPNAFVVAAIAVLTFAGVRFVRFLFAEVERGTITLPGFYRDWAAPTFKIVRFLVIVLAIVVAFPYLPGSNLPAFRAISVFLGLVFSLGSTSVVANIMAGLVLTYMRGFQIGDRVKIGETVGDVVEKTLLVTRVRTPKNVAVAVPNAVVLSGAIINYSGEARGGHLILNTSVTIGYDAPWRTVHRLLIEAALKTEDVLDDPKPFVLQTALNDFYVSYELNAHTDAPNRMPTIYSALHQNIQDAFRDAGVEIMSPHYRAMRDGNETTIPKKAE